MRYIFLDDFFSVTNSLLIHIHHLFTGNLSPSFELAHSSAFTRVSFVKNLSVRMVVGASVVKLCTNMRLKILDLYATL